MQRVLSELLTFIEWTAKPPLVCTAEAPIPAEAEEASTDASAAYLSKMQMLRELGFLSESSAEAEALARSQDIMPAVTRGVPGQKTDEERYSLFHASIMTSCPMFKRACRNDHCFGLINALQQCTSRATEAEDICIGQDTHTSDVPACCIF